MDCGWPGPLLLRWIDWERSDANRTRRPHRLSVADDPEPKSCLGATIEGVIRRHRCFELGKIVSKMPIHSTSGVVSVLQGVFLFVANFDNYATKFSRNVHNAPLWGQIRRMKSRRGSANGAALR